MDPVDELTQDCFNAAIALRHLDAAATIDPERIHRDIGRLVTRMIERASRLQVSRDDAQEIAYAIVALIDEVAVGGPSELSQYWVGHLLQMHFFDENVAGVGFFSHLKAIQTAQRYDVLRVYYTCLLLGFSGRYGMQGANELSDIALSARNALARGGLTEPESLSPRGDRPKEALTSAKKPLRFFWVPVGAVAGAVVLYLVLGAVIARQAQNLVVFIDSVVK